MKLISLKLRNFKGIRQFELKPNGQNVSVFGDNATGKTTLFDAFTWLLFDKDSQNKKDFEIKTLTQDGEPYHGLDHEVEAELGIGGRKITLRKVYKEKWTKKRGSATSEFTGHTTDHYLDGVPVKKVEYDAQMAEIALEDIFKLLTSPTYFNEQLHWQERRNILLEVCGDITDEEVVASDRALAGLPGILNGRKLEDHKKAITARRAEINRELERIPIRVDEAERGLPNISDIADEKELPNDIVKLRSNRRWKEQELSRIESGGETAEKRKQLRETEAELLQLRIEHRAEVDEKVGKKQKELYALKSQVLEGKSVMGRLKTQIEDLQLSIETLEKRNKELRETWHDVNSRQFEFEQNDVCPTCGQKLPQEKLDEAREKAFGDFNHKKSEELENITRRGKESNARITELRKEISEIDEKVVMTAIDVSSGEKLLGDLQKEIDDLLAGVVDVSEMPAYVQKLKEKEALEQTILGLQTDASEAAAKVRTEIGMLDKAISSLEQAVAKVNQYKQGQERINELKEEEQSLAAEFERLEQEVYLTEQFVKKKVALLEDRINSKFKLARFKLFNTLINGAVEECCETLYQGVPYSGGLNNGHRNAVGMDIINILSGHYGFRPPILVDNAESITVLPGMNAQVVRLVVSESDKKLRVEVESEKYEEAI